MCSTTPSRRCSTDAADDRDRRRPPCSSASGSWSTPAPRPTAAPACCTSRSATSRGCRSSTPPPTCSSVAAGRARCTRSLSPGCRRCWCRGPPRPRTIRPRTCGGSPTRARRCCSGRPTWGDLAAVIERLRERPDERATLSANAGDSARCTAGRLGVDSSSRWLLSLRGAVNLALVTSCPRRSRRDGVNPPRPLDLSTPRRLHVIGVGGPGMSAIALALAEMGHVVSGVDIRERPVLDRLRAAGRHGAHRSPPIARPRMRCGHRLDGDLVRPQRARRGAQARHPDAQSGRDAGLDLRAGRSRWPSPAPMARPRPRRC